MTDDSKIHILVLSADVEESLKELSAFTEYNNKELINLNKNLNELNKSIVELVMYFLNYHK